MANFQELFPAFRTRYFMYLGFAAASPQTQIHKMSSNKASIRAKIQVTPYKYSMKNCRLTKIKI